MRNQNNKPAGFIDRSLQGFANRNGISISTAYNEVRAGRLKTRKLGKRRLVTELDEESWQKSLPVDDLTA